MKQARKADRFGQREKLGSGGGSFPPYWNPFKGASIDIRVVDFEPEGPKTKFARWVFESVQDDPIECFRGSSGNQESEAVQKGDRFTCSGSLYGLRDLALYLGCEIRLLCTDRVDVGQAQKMWIFEIETTPETRQIVAERKLRQINGSKDTKQLAAAKAADREIPF